MRTTWVNNERWVNKTQRAPRHVCQSTTAVSPTTMSKPAPQKKKSASNEKPDARQMDETCERVAPILVKLRNTRGKLSNKSAPPPDRWMQAFLDTAVGDRIMLDLRPRRPRMCVGIRRSEDDAPILADFRVSVTDGEDILRLVDTADKDDSLCLLVQVIERNLSPGADLISRFARFAAHLRDEQFFSAEIYELLIRFQHIMAIVRQVDCMETRNFLSFWIRFTVPMLLNKHEYELRKAQVPHMDESLQTRKLCIAMVEANECITKPLNNILHKHVLRPGHILSDRPLTEVQRSNLLKVLSTSVRAISTWPINPEVVLQPLAQALKDNHCHSHLLTFNDLMQLNVFLRNGPMTAYDKKNLAAADAFLLRQISSLTNDSTFFQLVNPLVGLLSELKDMQRFVCMHHEICSLTPCIGAVLTFNASIQYVTSGKAANIKFNAGGLAEDADLPGFRMPAVPMFFSRSSEEYARMPRFASLTQAASIPSASSGRVRAMPVIVSSTQAASMLGTASARLGTMPPIASAQFVSLPPVPSVFAESRPPQSARRFTDRIPTLQADMPVPRKRRPSTPNTSVVVDLTGDDGDATEDDGEQDTPSPRKMPRHE